MQGLPQSCAADTRSGQVLAGRFWTAPRIPGCEQSPESRMSLATALTTARTNSLLLVRAHEHCIVVITRFGSRCGRILAYPSALARGSATIRAYRYASPPASLPTCIRQWRSSPFPDRVRNRCGIMAELECCSSAPSSIDSRPAPVVWSGRVSGAHLQYDDAGAHHRRRRTPRDVARIATWPDRSGQSAVRVARDRRPARGTRTVVSSCNRSLARNQMI
jgi:hypothetical protein